MVSNADVAIELSTNNSEILLKRICIYKTINLSLSFQYTLINYYEKKNKISTLVYPSKKKNEKNNLFYNW